MKFFDWLFGPSDKVTLTITMNPEAKERIRKLQEVSEGSTTRVVQKAFAVYELCLMAHARGATVFVREPDGTEREVVIK